LAKAPDILLGLIGKSLGHSLSPVIHGAFFDELGLSGRYDKIEIAQEDNWASRIDRLAQDGYVGLNVTIPYKLDVMPALPDLDKSAVLAGAVNTIRIDPEPVTGFNTDGSGLAEAISKMNLDDQVSTSGDLGSAMILGNGGAARAAVIALSSLGYKGLKVLSRKSQSAQVMLGDILNGADRLSLKENCSNALVCTFDQLSGLDTGAIGDLSLVINATPIGQKDDFVPDELVRFFEQIGDKKKTFVDLVYAKQPTPLCKVAQAAGFGKVEDGKEMLINQARLAFKIWTGQLPDGELARTRLNEMA